MENKENGSVICFFFAGKGSKLIFFFFFSPYKYQIVGEMVEL